MIAANKPTITIGMPVYNGEKYIEEAIVSLLNQSFRSFQLVISDNASSDKTSKICQKLASKDSRIIYFRQNTNNGAIKNFGFLLDKTETEYFMWAACDDLWYKNFLKDCLNLIIKHSDIVLVFPNFVNINSHGKVIRRYNPDKYITRGTFTNAFNYMKLYGSDGKANLIYGLWRVEHLRKLPLRDYWASDINYIFSAALGLKIGHVNKLLFKKRIIDLKAKDIKFDFSLFDKLIHLTDPIKKSINLAVDTIPYFYYLTLDTLMSKKIPIMLKVRMLIWIPFLIIRTIYSCRL